MHDKTFSINNIIVTEYQNSLLTCVRHKPSKLPGSFSAVVDVNQAITLGKVDVKHILKICNLFFIHTSLNHHSTFSLYMRILFAMNMEKQFLLVI